ncbi:45 kDa calcium-binding protein [Aphelenchoides bicaudatus]|nr:45 kDa calcium-binding protein [Aphelenchoides bicaudatus]
MTFKTSLLFVFLFLLLANCAPPLQRDNQLDKPNDIPVAANRPDHLKGVALERDGELNMDFRRELLEGNSHDNDVEHEKTKATESPEKIIEDMFKRADKDQDNRLSADELKHQIQENTKEHLADGRRQAEQLFQQVDENGDGIVSWDEYKAHFLVKNKIVDKEHAKEHVKEHGDSMDKNSRLKLEDEHAAFKRSDADNDGLDDAEWLGFQHPENSKMQLTEMTDEILRSFDRDHDGYLSIEEFAHLPEGVVNDPQMDREYVEARRHEFETQIDKDGDGKATKEELRAYVDPLNEYHAEESVSQSVSQSVTILPAKRKGGPLIRRVTEHLKGPPRAGSRISNFPP